MDRFKLVKVYYASHDLVQLHSYLLFINSLNKRRIESKKVKHNGTLQELLVDLRTLKNGRILCLTSRSVHKRGPM
jgi:hypothetical protein